MPSAEPETFDLPLRRLLDDVAARTPDPAGGPVCAIVLGFASALVAMSARFSAGHWAGAAAAAERAEALRRRAEPLAERDSRAYAGVLTALRLPSADREAALGPALEEAAAVPLELAELAADAAGLAAEVAERGNRNLRGDAATAASLAAACARAAANLVAINLAGRDDRGRIARAEAAAALAAAVAERALAPPG
ncbi:MAG: cyclodeaminase/cyclohydrolase family protein [Thermoleophilia bacterium]|nr:cyclodeaminase/cyclohydrolase family protein [Thermoleophilia bacterium]